MQIGGTAWQGHRPLPPGNNWTTPNNQAAGSNALRSYSKSFSTICFATGRDPSLRLKSYLHMRRRKEEAMCFHQEDQLLPTLQSSYSRVRSGLPSKQLAQSFAEAANMFPACRHTTGHYVPLHCCNKYWSGLRQWYMPWKLLLSGICSFAMWRINKSHWKTEICHFLSKIWIQKIKVQTSKQGRNHRLNWKDPVWSSVQVSF
jgi:hypothetical protein